MSLAQLLALYLLIGTACGIALIWRADAPRLRAAPSAAAAVVIWPLWIPFALSANGDEPPPAQPPLSHYAESPLAQRIQLGLQAASRPEHTGIVSPSDAAAISRAVLQSLCRLGAMTTQLDQHAPERTRLATRIEALEQSQSDPAALALARRHAATLTSLQALRAREEQALSDLADVIELMNAQLSLSQFDETTSLTELKAELWLRIDALQEAHDAPDTPAAPC